AMATHRSFTVPSSEAPRMTRISDEDQPRSPTHESMTRDDRTVTSASYLPFDSSKLNEIGCSISEPASAAGNVHFAARSVMHFSTDAGIEPSTHAPATVPLASIAMCSTPDVSTRCFGGSLTQQYSSSSAFDFTTATASLLLTVLTA